MKAKLFEKSPLALYLNFAEHNLSAVLTEVQGDPHAGGKSFFKQIEELTEEQLETLARYYFRFLDTPEFCRWHIVRQRREVREKDKDFSTEEGKNTRMGKWEDCETPSLSLSFVEVQTTHPHFLGLSEAEKDEAPDVRMFQKGSYPYRSDKDLREKEPELSEDYEYRKELHLRYNYSHMRKSLLQFAYKLHDLRNYYSHLYCEGWQLNLKAEGDDAFRAQMERLWTQAKWELVKKQRHSEESSTQIGVDYKKALKHHDLKKNTFRFFYRQEDKDGEFLHYKFDSNARAAVFLGAFFLNSGQTEDFMSLVKGFKKTGKEDKMGKAQFHKDYFQATRDIFTALCLRRLSRFHTGEGEVRAFMRILGNLNQIPREFVTHFKPDAMGFRFGEAQKKQVETLLLKFREDLEQDPKSLRDLRFAEGQNYSVEDLRSELGGKLKKQLDNFFDAMRLAQIREQEKPNPKAQQEAINALAERFGGKTNNKAKKKKKVEKPTEIEPLTIRKVQKAFKKAFSKNAQYTFAGQKHTHYEALILEKVMGYFQVSKSSAQVFTNRFVSGTVLLLKEAEKKEKEAWKAKNPEPEHERSSKHIKWRKEKKKAFKELEAKRERVRTKTVGHGKLLFAALVKDQSKKMHFADFKQMFENCTKKIASQFSKPEKETFTALVKDELENFFSVSPRLRKRPKEQIESLLQFLDDFEVLKNIRFQLYRYTGKVGIKKEKVYHNGKRFEYYEKDVERVYERMTTETWDEGFKYQVGTETHKNIPFQLTTKDEQDKAIHIHGKLSWLELRNLCALLFVGNKGSFEKNAEHIEAQIKALLLAYRKAYLGLEGGASVEAVKASFEEEGFSAHYLPRFKSPKLQERLKNQRARLMREMEALQEAATAQIRKYDKIQCITKFVNRFKTLDKEDASIKPYLDREQHQDLEILLGRLPASQRDFEAFFDLHHIKGQCGNKKFSSLFRGQYSQLDNLFNEIVKLQYNWAKNATPEALEAVLWSERQEKLQNKAKGKRFEPFSDFYYLPKNFLQRAFFGAAPKCESGKSATETFKEANFSNVGHSLRKAFDENESLQLPQFYDELEIPQDKPKAGMTEAEKKEETERRKFRNACEQQKHLDRVLLMVSQKYLGKITREDAQETNGFTLQADKLKDVFRSEAPLVLDIKIGKSTYFRFGFALSDWGRASRFLFDSRRKTLFKQYFERENPHFDGKTLTDAPKQNPSAEGVHFIPWVDREKLNTSIERLDHPRDMEEAYKLLERQQLEVVDRFLKLELQNLVNYTKDNDLKVKSQELACALVHPPYISRLKYDKDKKKCEQAKFKAERENWKYTNAQKRLSLLTIPAKVAFLLNADNENFTEDGLLSILSKETGKSLAEFMKLYEFLQKGDEVCKPEELKNIPLKLKYLDFKEVEKALKHVEGNTAQNASYLNIDEKAPTLEQRAEKCRQMGLLSNRIETATALRLRKFSEEENTKAWKEKLPQLIGEVRNRALHNDLIRKELELPQPDGEAKTLRNYKDALDYLETELAHAGFEHDYPQPR